jgi:hypothetical protein
VGHHVKHEKGVHDERLNLHADIQLYVNLFFFFLLFLDTRQSHTIPTQLLLRALCNSCTSGIWDLGHSPSSD